MPEDSAAGQGSDLAAPPAPDDDRAPTGRIRDQGRPPSREEHGPAPDRAAPTDRDGPALDPLGPWIGALGRLRGTDGERGEPRGGPAAAPDRSESDRPRPGRLRLDSRSAEATTDRIETEDRPARPTPGRPERHRPGHARGPGRLERDRGEPESGIGGGGLERDPRGTGGDTGLLDRDRRPADDARGRAEPAPHAAGRRSQGRRRRRPGPLFSPLAAVFGWLVAIGLGAILATLLGAVAAALSGAPTGARAESSGIGAVAAVIVAVLLAYAAGGYVSGRLARARGGARQGVAVWLLALLTAAILGALSAAAGQEFTLGERLALPRVTVEGGAEAALGVTAAIVIGSLVAAVLGAILGRRRRRRAETDR